MIEATTAISFITLILAILKLFIPNLDARIIITGCSISAILCLICGSMYSHIWYLTAGIHLFNIFIWSKIYINE